LIIRNSAATPASIDGGLWADPNPAPLNGGASGEAPVKRRMLLLNRLGCLDQSLQTHEALPSLLNATGEPDEFEADFHDVI